MSNVFVILTDDAAAGRSTAVSRGAVRELGALLPLVRGDLPAESLKRLCPEGMCYAWGVQETPANRALWETMAGGDLVLGYGERSIVSASYVIAKTNDPALAAALWGGDKGEPFDLLCFTDKPHVGEVPIVPQMLRYLDPEYRGFVKLPPEQVQNILHDYGSFEIFVSLCLRYGFPFSFRHSQD
jgi:hypothetical protein